MRKVKVLIDSWLLSRWTNKTTPGSGRARHESCTTSQGVQEVNEWRAGTMSPYQGIPCISNSASSRNVFQSIFLLLVLIMCYSPFHRRTRMGSKENIVSIGWSIHNTSRDLLKGNFNKGVFLCYEQTFCKNWHRSPCHTANSLNKGGFDG